MKMMKMTKMITVETISELRQHINEAKLAGKSVGFVPTMGYLHEGHMALVEAARSQNDLLVASVFVNPLQFGPGEDLEAYPRDFTRDAKLLQEHGVDLLFAPSTSEMYPQAMATLVDVGGLSQYLCGHSRPTHFQGVATVVSKLFHIVQPNRAYFGQKDAQQVVVIRRMVQDLNFPVEIVTIPIVREHDGLAKSSRNIYLTAEERPHATVLYQTLRFEQEQVLDRERSGVRLAEAMRARIRSEEQVRLDYAEVVDAQTLEPVTQISGTVLLAVAAYVGKARLIDNQLVSIERKS